MIFSDDTMIDRFNLDGRSWCWIGDGSIAHWTSTCPSNHEAWWWIGDDLEIHDDFWGGSKVQKIEGRINRYVDEYILEFSCSPLCKITFWNQIGWSFSMIMIPNTQAMSCKMVGITII